MITDWYHLVLDGVPVRSHFKELDTHHHVWWVSSCPHVDL